MPSSMSSLLHFMSTSDTSTSSNIILLSMSCLLHFMSNRVLSMLNPITTCWRTLVKHPLHGSEYIVLELLHISAGGQTISFSMILSTHTWCRSCHVSGVEKWNRIILWNHTTSPLTHQSSYEFTSDCASPGCVKAIERQGSKN